MSQAIVESVRINFPTPLGARHGECLIAIAQALGGGAGLLKKDTGTYVVLPDGTKVSQDIICYPDGRHFDCLADGEGEARPAWAFVGMIDPARYLPVGQSAPEPEPPTDPAEPEPPSGDDSVELLRGIYAELRVLNAHLGARAR